VEELRPGVSTATYCLDGVGDCRKIGIIIQILASDRQSKNTDLLSKCMKWKGQDALIKSSSLCSCTKTLLKDLQG
jgi:hypothetical protein